MAAFFFLFFSLEARSLLMLFGERHGTTQAHCGRGDGIFSNFSSRTLRIRFPGRRCSTFESEGFEANAAFWAGIDRH